MIKEVLFWVVVIYIVTLIIGKIWPFCAMYIVKFFIFLKNIFKFTIKGDNFMMSKK